MNYRSLPDPHNPFYEWRVVNGVRQLSYEYWTTGWADYGVTNIRVDSTPARITMWADLALNPYEP